ALLNQRQVDILRLLLQCLYLWTLYLASLGGAVCLVTAILLLSRLARLPGLFLALASIAVALASVQALQQQTQYVDLALVQQRLLGQLVEQAPQLTDHSLVVVIDEAKALDDGWLFGYSSWLTAAIHYVYGNQTLTAVICYPDEE